MKKKSSLTEADVYEANRELVFMMCKNHGKSLEREDRNAIASMGMLGAIRSLDKQLKNSDGSTKYIDMVAAFNEDSTSSILVSDFIRFLENR